MLRRTADSAFWLGRYVERAEATARMVDVHYRSVLERSLGSGSIGWESILSISGQEEDFHARYPKTDEYSILHFFAFDQENPSSVISCIAAARENARAIRGQISSEMWESVNRWYLDLREWDIAVMEQRSAFDFFRRVKDGSHLFHGIVGRTLTIGEARDFFTVGQYLERADQTARILDVHYEDLASLEDPHGWTAVLKSVGAYEAYLKTFRQGVTADRVAEFLVTSPVFPASILFSVAGVQISLRRISGNQNPVPSNSAERTVGKLHSDLVYLTKEEMVDQELHEFLENVQERCADVGNAVWDTYLSY
jgi:uncharacterized alpha-E superfamily protein